ncbi:hypothetical protein PMI36_05161, partial [Pseudomonas sp. GM79]
MFSACEAAFASKPAPTGERGQMWEQARSHRGTRSNVGA